MNSARKVAITGVGMVTPVGCTAPATWASLLAGRSGIGTIRQFDASGFPVFIGAEVKNLAPEAIACEPNLLKFASRSHRFALAAAAEALADAGIAPAPGNAHRWGLSVGAGMLGTAFNELEAVHDFCIVDGEFNPDGLLKPDYPVDPVAFCRSQTNAGLALLTRRFGIMGYATSVHTACASGGQALGTAMKVIRR